MNQTFVIFPLLWQMLIALVLLFCWYKPNWHRSISITGSVLALFPAIYLFIKVYNDGIAVMNAGSWAAPYGISMVSDLLSATMVLVTTVSGLAVSIFSLRPLLGNRINFGYFPVFHFMLMGICGAFLAGDVFNLYVWFEIMLITAFVLLSLGGLKAQLEGAVKYFTLNILASIIFLTAVALLYGLTGSLNMADISLKLAAVEQKTLVRITAIIFLVGFGIKSAIFPLYFWLPASYHTPPAAVSAIFGGLLTKVGVYAMIRIFILVFPEDPFINNLLITVAIITVVMGGFGAAVKPNIQRIFAYLIICHIGFMVLGVGMRSELALVGLIFYMIHDIIVKTNLFMVGGLLYQMEGTWDKNKVGGIYAKYPWLSLLMVIPLFSLIGIPPLSGFWPKISLVLAGIEQRQYWAVGAIMLGSFLTLYIIAKLWADVFWKKGLATERRAAFLYFDTLSKSQQAGMVAPIVLLAAVSLYIGFGAGQVQMVAERISNELSNTQGYIDAVLHNSNQQGGTP